MCTLCCRVTVALISLLNWNRLLLLIMFNETVVVPLSASPPSSFRGTSHFLKGRQHHYSIMKMESSEVQYRVQKGLVL